MVSLASTSSAVLFLLLWLVVSPCTTSLHNKQDGTIPEYIGFWQDLQVLGLSDNYFDGSVPMSFSALNKMKTLAIDDNNLVGGLDFADSLTSLEFFYANDNDLSGTLDSNFLANLKVLRELDLSNNNLHTPNDPDRQGLPPHLFQHASLEVLDLRNNFLKGPLPAMTPNQVLKFLSVRNNDLTGAISPANLPMLSALTHLDV